MLLIDILEKISQNIFAYSYVSENSMHFFFRKKIEFLVAAPPLLASASASAKNASFFYVLSKSYSKNIIVYQKLSESH